MQKQLLMLLCVLCLTYSLGYRVTCQRAGARASQQKFNIDVDHAHAPKFSVGKAVAMIGTITSRPSLAVAEEDNVRNVFQPNIDPAAMSSSIIYAVVPIVIYFVFNSIIAPKLGLIKEVETGSDNFPPENKTPF